MHAICHVQASDDETFPYGSTRKREREDEDAGQGATERRSLLRARLARSLAHDARAPKTEDDETTSAYSKALGSSSATKLDDMPARFSELASLARRLAWQDSERSTGELSSPEKEGDEDAGSSGGDTASTVLAESVTSSRRSSPVSTTVEAESASSLTSPPALTASASYGSPVRATAGMSAEDIALYGHIKNFYAMLDKYFPESERNYPTLREAVYAVKSALGSDGTDVFIFSPAFKSGVESGRIFSTTFAAMLVPPRVVRLLDSHGHIPTELEARSAVVEVREQDFAAKAEAARAAAIAALSKRSEGGLPPHVRIDRLTEFRRAKPDFARIVGSAGVTPLDVMDGFIRHLSPYFDSFVIDGLPVYIALEFFCNPMYDVEAQIKDNLSRMEKGNNPSYIDHAGNKHTGEVHHILEVDGPLVWLHPRDHDASMHPGFATTSRIDRTEFNRLRISLNQQLARLLKTKYGYTD